MVAFCVLKNVMFTLTTETYKKIFYGYISGIILLLILPLNGTISLTEVYFGFRSDHIVHCSIFIPFILLCYLSKSVVTSARLLAIGLLFAGFCESLHIFIPYRNASIFDCFANCFGILIGYLFYTLGKRLNWFNISNP